MDPPPQEKYENIPLYDRLVGQLIETHWFKLLNSKIISKQIYNSTIKDSIPIESAIKKINKLSIKKRTNFEF